MDADERAWVARGLYDPDAPGADDRLATLRYLSARGATTDDLAAAIGDGSASDQGGFHGLQTVASDLLRRRWTRLTIGEAAEQAGMPVELARRVIRTAGLGDPAPDEAEFFDADVTVLRLFAGASEMFGVESTLQFTRVAGVAMASMADAAMSNFGLTVAPRLDAEAAGELARTEAAAAAASILFDEVPKILGPLFIHHCESATRRVQVAGGLETSDLTVGFLDLVGSTLLAERLPPAELGALISEFEQDATELVSATDGRVVKMIGDEVMFVTTDAAAACALALEVADRVERHAALPLLRGGLAAGPLVRGYGDYYGPVVNTAARAAKLAEPGSILVTAAVRERAAADGLSFVAVGDHALRGLDLSVALFRLERA